MRKVVFILAVLILAVNLQALSQTDVEEGTVSFITSQNVYVKFKSTATLNPGDTLFVNKDNMQIPALIISNKSSISCVCVRITDIELKVSDKVFSAIKEKAPPAPLEGIPPSGEPLPETYPSDTAVLKGDEKKKPDQDISGRVSVSSYLNFSNTAGGNAQRMRYTFSMNAKNIAKSNLTGECYISFITRSDNWDQIKQDVFNGLKIYNLSLRYDFNPDTKLWLGRKINPKMSSLGAIDGVQFEKKIRSLSFGIIAGTRPDVHNYGFDFSLFQAGAYISHDFSKGKGNMNNTLAFIDQENSWNTDRRFLYFQHHNSLLKNLYFFGSIELDLYEKVDSVQSATLTPTNFYFLLRYKIIKQLTLSLSYSARNNIIYYETYKDIVEKLQESSALQGISVQAQYRPVSKLSIGAKAGYRSRKEDPKPSWNADGYITYSQIPLVKISLTGSVTFLQSGYLNGKIYSAGISRDIFPGKIYAAVNYKFVDYRFESNETAIAQNMAEINMNWNIYRKLLFSINYEGTFESSKNKYNRVFINLTQRF